MRVSKKVLHRYIRPIVKKSARINVRYALITPVWGGTGPPPPTAMLRLAKK